MINVADLQNIRAAVCRLSTLLLSRRLRRLDVTAARGIGQEQRKPASAAGSGLRRPEIRGRRIWGLLAVWCDESSVLEKTPGASGLYVGSCSSVRPTPPAMIETTKLAASNSTIVTTT